MGELVERDIWRIFCAEEEASLTPADAYGRILYRNRSLYEVKQPCVSEFLYENGFRPYYPDNHPFAVCISHDVDHLLQPDFSNAGRLKEATKELVRGYWRRSLRYLKADRLINPRYNIDILLDIEQKLDVTSTFYFLALTEQDEDFNYRISEVRPLLQQILHRNCEIGLHGGHIAYRDISKLLSEKCALEEASGIKVEGYRNHFLRIQTPDTWEALAAAGFAYDTTYGFPDHPGFRNGMCYPYFPFNTTLGRWCTVLEIPLLVMDATFVYYLNSNEKEAFRTVKQMIDQTRSVNGVFTLLWHNNYLSGQWKRLYQTILEYCKQHNAWFATGAQMNEWWRLNGFCKDYSSFGLHPVC